MTTLHRNIFGIDISAVPEVRSMFCRSSSSRLIFSSSSDFMASNSNVRSLCNTHTHIKCCEACVSGPVQYIMYMSASVCVTSRCCLAPCSSHSCLCLITCRHSSLYTPAGRDTETTRLFSFSDLLLHVNYSDAQLTH